MPRQAQDHPESEDSGPDPVIDAFEARQVSGDHLRAVHDLLDNRAANDRHELLDRIGQLETGKISSMEASLSRVETHYAALVARMDTMVSAMVPPRPTIAPELPAVAGSPPGMPPSEANRDTDEITPVPRGRGVPGTPPFLRNHRYLADRLQRVTEAPASEAVPDPPQGHDPVPGGMSHAPDSYWHWGALVPGVRPLTTLVLEFQPVIDYRSYRLANTSATDNHADVYRGNIVKMVERMRGSMPRLTDFDGTHPLALLTFFREFRRALNAMGLSEGAAVHLLSYVLVKGPLQVYSQFTFAGIRSSSRTPICWASVVNTMLERYISDDVIADAHGRVMNARQLPPESESDFAGRLEHYADECSGVFSDTALLHHFVRGLLPTTQSIVSERVRQLTASQTVSFNLVRRIAHAEGTTYRARMRQAHQTPPPAGRLGVPGTPLGGRSMYVANDANPDGLDVASSHHDPVFAMHEVDEFPIPPPARGGGHDRPPHSTGGTAEATHT